jgi:hypothetical protein
MTGSTKPRIVCRRMAGALVATVLFAAGCTVAATVAPPAPLNYGAVTTIAGGGNAPVASTPPQIGDAHSVARFGNMLYVATTGNGVGSVVIARNLDTGEQTLYAGSMSQMGYAGDGGPAADALLEYPGLMAVDHDGNLYITENDQPMTIHCDIRMIAAAAPHIITTYAGADVGLDPAEMCNSGLGDGGDANLAGFSPTQGLAFDSHDNLFITSGNGGIRRIDRDSHIIDTYAGYTFSSDYIDTPNPNDGDPPATLTDARFNGTRGLAFDASDNLYISDVNNNAIRMIDTGSSTPAVTTVAGGTVNAPLPRGYADGPVGTAQFDLGGNAGLAVSPTTGELSIDDDINNRIRSLSADRATVTTIAGNGTLGHTGDGGPAVDAAIIQPKHMTFDAAGGLYFPEGNDNQLRYVGIDGVISNRSPTPTQPGGDPPPFTGDGGQATDAILQQPSDLLRLGSSLYVAESNGHRVRKIDLATGIISTFAGTGIAGFSGDDGAATAAQIAGPIGLAGDARALFVATSDARIRRIDIATGIITTVAGTGIACDVSTHACGDNGPATSARIGTYVGLASASGGRLIIADAIDNRVRCIGCNPTHPTWMTRIAGTGTPGDSPSGRLATTTRITTPIRVVIAPDNTIVFSELTSGMVRRINADGTLSTIAGIANNLTGSGDGGLATRASIAGAAALRYDAAGNLDIGQVGGNPFTQTFVNPGIRQINTTTGVITTIAGNGSPGFSGDGGSAKLASFFFPVAFAPDDGTHLYVADMVNNRVRRIRGVRPDLVTTTAVSVFKAGTTGTLTVSEQSASNGWVSGPVKAIVTLPARLNYQSASGIGWTCRASSGHTVTCTHARGIAPRTTTPVTLRLAVTAGAAATVSVHVTSTTDSDVLDASHQSKTRSIHIVH